MRLPCAFRDRDSKFYSFLYDAIFFSLYSIRVIAPFRYSNALTFLPNAAPCNLWTDHRIDNLIESTWRGHSLFRANARMPCRSSLGQWDLLFLERALQGFRKRSRFAIRDFVFRIESRLPSVRILPSAFWLPPLTIPRKMLFSSFRCNFIGLILQFELTSAVSNLFRRDPQSIIFHGIPLVLSDRFPR